MEENQKKIEEQQRKMVSVGCGLRDVRIENDVRILVLKK